MGKRSRGEKAFWRSGKLNNGITFHYFNQLTELAMSVFKWKNMPETIDTRFLEMILFRDGQSVFFFEDGLGYLALQTAMSGGFNVYQIPKNRRAYAVNGFQRNLTGQDSVIIYNNLMHTNSVESSIIFSEKLMNIDRTIDVNVHAQKTPILILCDESERLTMENLYMKYDGNQPVIKGEKGLNVDGIKVLNTGAPFLADKLYQLKVNVWNEALTVLGISNVSVNKKERLVTDEVTRGLGGVLASRNSKLKARQQACEQINSMFDLDIWCEFDEEMIEQIDSNVQNESEVAQ